MSMLKPSRIRGGRTGAVNRGRSGDWGVNKEKGHRLML